MNLGLKVKVLFRELPNQLVRFNELLLLARSRSLFAEANATRTERNTLVQGGA
jgi:hypothetical protein